MTKRKLHSVCNTQLNIKPVNFLALNKTQFSYSFKNNLKQNWWNSKKFFNLCLSFLSFCHNLVNLSFGQK